VDFSKFLKGAPPDELLMRPVRQALEDPCVLTFTTGRKDAEPDADGLLVMLMGFLFLMHGVTSGEWVMILVGGGIILGGYGLAFNAPRRVDFDLLQRRWREQEAGVRPFVHREEGALEEWEQVRFAREQRTKLDDDESGNKVTFDVWCVSLIARGGRRPPLTLTHFAFPCD